MTTIYVLTTGEYSDYHILGVYSTVAKATEAQKSYGDARIEEYTIDAYKPIVGYYDVGINKCGEIQFANPHTLEPWEIEPNAKGVPNYMEQMGFTVFSIGGDNATLYWKVATDDNERAIKVVAEKWAQIISLGLWNDSAGVRRHIR